MSRIGIIGAGAAGMMAAAAAAEAAPDAQVVVYEKNEKPGKKLYITGKGRCNLTNTCETAESFGQIRRNPKFLCSAIYGFDHDAVMRFFEESGVRLKVERGGRVFPVSDHASDITKALEKRMRRAGVELRLNTAAARVITEDCTGREDAVPGKRVVGIKAADGKRERFDAVIIAAGGISYPQTGSTGDGYRFAQESGHRIEACRPSLVPMETREEWCRDLQGLSLRNVRVSLYAAGNADPSAAGRGNAGKAAGKPLADEFGEMLFTHFGVSGPVILRLSAVPDQKQMEAGLFLEIDLKPALDEKMLDRRILRDLEKYSGCQMHNALKDLLPQRLIPVILEEAGIERDWKAGAVTKAQRAALNHALKHVRVHIRTLRGYQEAIVTRGGVSVREINASTMESKLVKGLYFAGEVIDTDALTGGYNLQIAWSTGHLAGVSAALAAGKK